jgi:hypothetical protein
MSIHVATFDNLAVTTATDLLHGTVTTDKPVELMEVKFAQFSDLSDAAEEVLRVGLFRGVTGGTGGTALTEVPLNGGQASSSLVLLAHNSSISTGGSQIDLEGWNIRGPFFWCPVPELRPIVTAALDPFSFRLMAAPTD